MDDTEISSVSVTSSCYGEEVENFSLEKADYTSVLDFYKKVERHLGNVNNKHEVTVNYTSIAYSESGAIAKAERAYLNSPFKRDLVGAGAQILEQAKPEWMCRRKYTVSLQVSTNG